MSETRLYESLTPVSHIGFRSLLENRDYDSLQSAIIGLALHDEDGEFVERACLMLFETCTEHEYVRGNAVLGLGHLARRFGALTEASPAAIEAGLRDPSDWVSGKATCAAEDAQQFLGWTFDGIPPDESYPP